ncbi:nucleotide exchange factor GrpE [Candidatus Woesearchaeota archaeon]|nr:nucleotide exchange factor GrpE [Candidatus Woesearchaeota archaeon]MBW3005468.1 nucleotide exchange factor GrpE [Candidatus Woesearchaeota archaeon]
MAEKNKKTEADKLKEQVAEYEDQLKRLQAEFENYQKRIVKEQKDFVCFANEKLIAELLTIMDDFEKALPNVKDEGIKMIYNKISKLLSDQGVKPIKSKGEKFDTFKHEVLCTEEGDDEDVIVEEIQKGYEMNGKVIRYAKVKITKAKKSVGGGTENE